MEYVLWVFAYISLFVTLLWLQTILIPFPRQHKTISSFPSVSILIPAYNEADTIGRTLESLAALRYPRKKLDILVIDDGSTDTTATVARRFSGVTVLRQHNKGKASALNYGLQYARGEFVACLDADSSVHPDSLRNLITHFSDPSIGAVICAIHTRTTHTLLEKLQRFEYIFAAYMRKLMARIHTLAITPGVLSTYRTSVLRNLGGFDENRRNLTEDFEIALRLAEQGYRIFIETKSIGYTSVPSTLYAHYRQRVRWYRGFIFNILKYKHLLFNGNYGMLGLFSLPLGVLSVFMLLTTFSFIGYKLFRKLSGFITDLSLLHTDYLHLFTIPDLKLVLLNLDIRLWFPVLLILTLVTYLFILAYRDAGERWKYLWVYPLYLVYYPYLQVYYWAAALYKESTRRKPQW